eukprot:m.106160 g.106160  ORF g.106160 m.106160 type:complete len:204 (-) comp13294_c0_seq3:289-900(-)
MAEHALAVTPAAPAPTHTNPRLRTTATPRIVNLVATVHLGCTLDLKHIAVHARNAEYSPKRFSAVIMRIREPQTTALIFKTGKMVCTGAKSEDMAYRAGRKFAKMIRKLGFQVRFENFTVQNMVGSVDVKFPIRLEALAANNQQFCTYEPECFPGLIYRMASPKVVLLVFVSGKIVITGAKKREDIVEAFSNLHAILLQFRKS